MLSLKQKAGKDAGLDYEHSLQLNYSLFSITKIY